MSFLALIEIFILFLGLQSYFLICNAISNRPTLRAPQTSNDVRTILLRFNGTFSNDAQIVENIKIKRSTFELGGHENVTASFSAYPSSPNDSVIARFCFDGNVSKTFRYRLYKFISNNKDNKIVEMKLYRPNIISSKLLLDTNYNADSYVPVFEDFEELCGCNVHWKRHGLLSKVLLDISIFKHLLPSELIDKMVVYRGLLEHGTCRIPSANNPNVILTVKDDLKLGHDYLWINDQVYNNNGIKIIGNKLGIPYKFKRLNHSNTT